MSLEQAFQISLVDFLAWLGHRPTKTRGCNYWYLSPYRNEKKASFKVNIELNRWFDFGTGKGGGIISLGKLIYQTNDTSFVLRLLQEHTGVRVNRHNKPPCSSASKGAEWVNVTTQRLTSYPLFDYLQKRGIPGHIASKFCCEISYELRGKRYYSIGFLNKSGGYELRNPYFKGCMGKKDISILRSTPSEKKIKRVCCLFEGIFDFMSHQVLVEMGIFQESEDEQSDYLILNSVSNLSKVGAMLDDYDSIYTYLDNDAAGKNATEMISEAYRDKVKDFAIIYDFHNDLNDYLCSVIKDEGEKKSKPL